MLNDLGAKIRAAWLSLPLFVRNFVIDAVEGSAAVIVTLNLLIPRTLDEALAQALIIGTALVVPVVAAARRHILPAFFRLLVYLFPRPDSEGSG